MIVYAPWDGVLLPWGGAIRSLRSALHLPSLAVSLTVAALVLTACSSDDDSSSETPADARTSTPPVLSNISDDGTCDPGDIDHAEVTVPAHDDANTSETCTMGVA